MTLLNNLPGWGLMAAVALLSSAISSIVVVGGKQPVEAAVIAILIGIAVRNTRLLPAACMPGIRAFEKPLVLGIVFMGAKLNYLTIGAQGAQIFSVILITMLLGYLVIYTLAKVFRLPSALSILLAVGTTICGGSAIAITAPLIQAPEEETSYAIGTVALWGLVAIIVYPAVAALLGVSDFAFGVFAGTAIHSTPQVVGAGFIFSEEAGNTATAVKLVRNCFMLPLAFCIGAWATKRALQTQNGITGRKSLAKAFPWFLFGYFIMATANTLGYLSPEQVELLAGAGKFLILAGMAGVGLNTAFTAFRSIGLKPLIVGLCGSLVVAATSAALVVSTGLI